MRTMAGALALATGAMLFGVAWKDYRTARRTLATIETKIQESIKRKGHGLATNHALALRGLVADNAFSDVANLVQGAVKEDNELLYGLFLAADGKPWAYVSPLTHSNEDTKAGSPTPITDLQLDPTTARLPGVKFEARQLFGVRAFEFSAPVQGEDGMVAGRIYYGLSGKPLELALAEARKDSRDSLILTVVVLGFLGTIAILLGFFVIKRAVLRIITPLATLTEVTATIARGQRDVRASVSTDDEIGVLGKAFNQMLDEVNDSWRKLEELNHSLEQRVDDRTRELGHRNRDMRLVLDNVSQGFLTISREGVLAQERSAICDRWFGRYDGQVRFLDYIKNVDSTFADSFGLGFDALNEEILPIELCLDQLPRRIRTKSAEYACEYLPLTSESGSCQGLLIVINDITAQLEHARQEAEQREMLAMMQALTGDRAGFLSFFDEATRMIEELEEAASDPDWLKRSLHTLKGNAALLGLQVVADICHKAEDEIAEAGPEGARVTIISLEERWRTLGRAVDMFLGDRGRDVVEISAIEINAIANTLSSGGSIERAIHRLRTWQMEPASRSLSRLGQSARSLARRLGKGEVDIVVDADGVLLDPSRWTALTNELVHVVRNAVDHGLASVDERSASKNGAAQIRLSARLSGERFSITISDNGRGIDWEAIRQAATRRGLPAVSRADLTAAIFASDVTTSAKVTSVSGRGVGLSSVKQRVLDLGGEIHVESAPGTGTTFLFSFPAEGVVARDVLSPADRVAAVGAAQLSAV